MATAKGYRRRFLTPKEVSVHHTEDDCWVSAMGCVLDLTPLVAAHRGALTEPIVRAAGTDITHWFDQASGDIKTHVDPKTGLEVYYTPNGRFVHVPAPIATTELENDYDIPWWKDELYKIGFLTKKTRRIRIVNALTAHEATLEVCAEETLNEIQDRYLEYNGHAASYTWKRMGRELDMEKTLDENEILDESDEFQNLGLPEDYYVPALHLYFNDDLTVG
jgi:hypothetical protein